MGYKKITEKFKKFIQSKQLIADHKENKKLLNSTTPMHKEIETLFPSGHFYSPIPSIEKIKEREWAIFNREKKEILGVSLNEGKQLELLEELAEFYPEIPFKDKKSDGLRYFYHNDAYSYGDAIILYLMIRHLKPKRIIEIGSGYSSCVMLDVNELYFSNTIKISCIEPYADLLKSLVKKRDIGKFKLIEKDLQKVPLDYFNTLQNGDILFIDSTHVSKVGSDVNYIIFEILPRLNTGVCIHIHDIFYPFEYPKEWIYEGRAWNEDYIIRAFLEYNDAFEIIFFNNYMYNFHKNRIGNLMPSFLKNQGGGLWLRKIQNKKYD